jgi:hypothetical protein
MEILSSLLVGKPLPIAAVAALFLVGHFLLRLTRTGSNRHPRALLVVAAAWAFYAAWEGLVITVTPEANIRVDLLLIWPIVLILSIWFAIRAFR